MSPNPAEEPTRTDLPAAEPAAPTESLVAGTVGDRCVSCGAPLASDQRYCVVCGERRGAPRFSLPAEEAPTAVVASVARRPRSGPRFSSGTTLVAGVATLLLAVPVGVLIGRGVGANETKTVAARQAPIVINGGAGTGTTANGSASTAGSGSTVKTTKHKKSGSSKHHAAKAAPKVSKATAKKQSSAAAKVLGGSNKNVPAATVTVGQKGSGAGFSKKTHKFTGQFFGQ